MEIIILKLILVGYLLGLVIVGPSPQIDLVNSTKKKKKGKSTSRIRICLIVQKKKHTILTSFRCCYMLDFFTWNKRNKTSKYHYRTSNIIYRIWCINRNMIKHKQRISLTRAVLPLLSDSFGSRPRFNNWCNNKSSPLSAAKHRLRGRSILPRASMFSVSNKTPFIMGSSRSFRCCSTNKETATLNLFFCQTT